MSEPVLEPQDGVGTPDGFRRLWTPHRLAYIKDAGEGGCPLCRIPTLPDEEGLVVARGEVVYAVLEPASRTTPAISWCCPTGTSRRWRS